jgi:hypothetical protein
MPLYQPVGGGTWTPVLSITTPGNLAVTYSNQVGTYEQRGNIIIARFSVSTSAFTHTTASGNWRITGLPFTVGTGYGGDLEWSGVTKANYTQITPRPTAANTIIQFFAEGSAQAGGFLAAADIPTGGSVILNGTVIYTL